MINEGDLPLNEDNNLQELLSEISVSDTRAILFGTLGIYNIIFNRIMILII